MITAPPFVIRSSQMQMGMVWEIYVIQIRGVAGVASRFVSSNADKRGIGEKVKRLRGKKHILNVEFGVWKEIRDSGLVIGG